MEMLSPPGSLPTTRQKNCNSCVQAKRRCDRRTPICSRCVDKRIACTYSNQDLTSQFDRNLPEPSAVSPGVTDFGLMPMDPQFGVATTEHLQNYSVDTCFDGDTSMDPFIDILDDSIMPNPDQWLVQLEQGEINERTSSPVDQEVVRAYAKMAGVCVRPIHLHPPSASLPSSALVCCLGL